MLPNADDSVADAISAMLDYGTGLVTVLDARGTVIGEFTEHDVFTKIACRVEALEDTSFDADSVDGLSASDFATSAHSHGASAEHIFTRWGNGTCPSGTTLLYAGYAFNAHYTYGGGGAAATCVAPNAGDPGPAPALLGDLLYPLGLDSASYAPPGVGPMTEVKCAVCLRSALDIPWESSTRL